MDMMSSIWFYWEWEDKIGIRL